MNKKILLFPLISIVLLLLILLTNGFNSFYTFIILTTISIVISFIEIFKNIIMYKSNKKILYIVLCIICILICIFAILWLSIILNFEY